MATKLQPVLLPTDQGLGCTLLIYSVIWGLYRDVKMLKDSKGSRDINNEMEHEMETG